MRASVSTQAYRNLNAQMSWDANSGSPYTITTGIDENGDSIFNDRPFQVPRNSVRLPWRSTISANVSYLIPIGKAPGPEGGRPGAGGRGPGRTRRTPEGHHDQRLGAEPDQPLQLLRLQRRDDLAVLPAGDERVEPAPGRHLAPLQLLALRFRFPRATSVASAFSLWLQKPRNRSSHTSTSCIAAVSTA